jgi:hypothetical protein
MPGDYHPGPIPRRLHQIWIGPAPLPEPCRRFCAALRAMHPGWTYQLHGNELFRRYATDPLLKTQLALGTSWAFIADRLRTLLLFDEGGVYADVDCEPVRSLDGVLEEFPAAEFITATFPGSSDTDVTVLFSARHSWAAGEMIRTIEAPHRTGRAMLRFLNDSPSAAVALAPSNWWYANRRDDAVFLFHQGHRMRTWTPSADAGTAHEWAVIGRTGDGALRLVSSAPEKRNLLAPLEDIDPDHFAACGIWRICKSTAATWKK